MQIVAGKETIMFYQVRTRKSAAVCVWMIQQFPSGGKIFINQYGTKVYRVHFNTSHINEGHHSAPFSKGAFTLRIMSSKQASNPGSHFHAIFISAAYLETYIVSSHPLFSSFEGLISIYIAT